MQKDWENFKKEILTKDQQTILDIKMFCRKLVENYQKEYAGKPIKGQDTMHAMMGGMAITADSILEIINERNRQ